MYARIIAKKLINLYQQGVFTTSEIVFLLENLFSENENDFRDLQKYEQKLSFIIDEKREVEMAQEYEGLLEKKMLDYGYLWGTKRSEFFERLKNELCN